jgi:aspartyl-tRNA(Asn)/glutamyl-tRNA(Gln) amidotransferase subunit A
MAAGLCGFAIGSDTGGSVRLPAAFCGVVGIKPTWGMWPLDGVYPTCPSLDTLGPLTRSADDAAIVVSALSDIVVPRLESVRGLRLGRPTNHFFDGLDPEVEACVGASLAALEEEGAVLVDMEIPEIEAADEFFHAIIGGEFLAGMGRERFLADREAMGFILAARGASGLDVMADAYIQQRRWQDTACRRVADRLRGLDAVVTPTIPILPAPASDFPDLERATRLAQPISKNTYFANMFRLCAATMPVHHFGSRLPVGLQITCAEGEDGKLLAIGRAVEGVIGAAAAPDVGGFLQ